MSGFHIEKGGFHHAAATDARHRAGLTWLLNSVAAIDARHHTYPRRHDMAAGTLRRDDLLSKMLQQSSQITCPSSNSLSNPILLKAKSFLPKSLSDAPR